MNTDNNKVYESLDITDNFCTYFESTEEWTEFYNRIQEQFEDLRKKGYKDICFNINAERYSEHGESYSDVKLVFDYTRELTEKELKELKEIQQTREEDEKIFSELCGKLSTNSIGSIMANEDLRKLYLEGNIKI